MNWNKTAFLSGLAAFLPGLLLAQGGFEWSRLPPLPDREGLAGCFAGVSGGALLVAGGANFPDKKPWEGGKKVWHDTVYALEQFRGEWKVVGKLPRPLAYGVSVTVPGGVVCIGGNDAQQTHAEVFLLTLTNGNLQTKLLPRLLVSLANASGVLVDNTIYLFGGTASPTEQSAFNRLFTFDVARPEARWKEQEPCPGKARILSVVAGLEGALYIVGGAAIQETNGAPYRVFLHDGWCYQPGHGWRQIADLPKPVAAAPSPAPVFGSRFVVIGGDDGVGFRPVENHPGFPKRVWAYDARKNAWMEPGQAPFSRATLPVVWWQDRFVLPSGESRPGIRSREVWTIRHVP